MKTIAIRHDEKIVPILQRGLNSLLIVGQDAGGSMLVSFCLLTVSDWPMPLYRAIDDPQLVIADRSLAIKPSV